MCYLKLSDKQAKDVYFDIKRGVVILVNSELNSDHRMIVHLIKLSQTLSGSKERFNSDSEDEQMSPGPHDLHPIGIKFHFVRKLTLKTATSDQCTLLTGIQVSKRTTNEKDEYVLNTVVSDRVCLEHIIPAKYSQP